MKSFFYISLVILIFSCQKDELGPQCVNCSEEENHTEIADVLIINEGNFGWGNGSLSLYKPIDKTISNSVFQQANNSIPLGDVVQSAYQNNNNIYVIANNSGKIEVMEKTNFVSTATITGFNSPRYFYPVSQNKAYVTDLYSNSIQIVDVASNSITGSIVYNGWTEQLIMHNDTVYVCDMTNDNLLIINPNTDNIVDSVKLGVQPNSIVKDQNNKLWIMCDGGFNETNPQLIRFNPQTRAIEATFTFPILGDSPGNLSINKTGDVLYYINSNVYQMTINDASLPLSALISNAGNTFYGLGIDPINEDVYISDAIDYVQNGLVFRYSSTGGLIHQFNVGIIPGNFLFIQ
jgi:YVTN family beta-propeller protein